MITIEDFKKLEIRIGKVVSAEKVPDSKKLLRLIFDFGSEQRQILAGISESFPDPSVLVGKEIPVLFNLEPRELMGYKSEGMIMAIDSDSGIVLLHPEREVPPGSLVR